MEWLNYHHLRYFHAVAKEGSIARASELLHTSSPSISTQIAELERNLGERLFERRGRGLVLTEMGRVVQEYAEQIFTLGGELMDTVRGQPSGRPARMRIGIADAVPKELAARLLEPLFGEQDRARVVVREDASDRLLTELALYHLDLVVTDEEPIASSRLRVFQHPLGDSGIAVFGVRRLTRRLRGGFPESLRAAPFILPIEHSALRSAFDHWRRERELSIDVVAEVEDLALAKTLARQGSGLLLAPEVLAATLKENYALSKVGILPGVSSRFVACTVARKVTNPAVARLLASARDLLAE